MGRTLTGGGESSGVYNEERAIQVRDGGRNGISFFFFKQKTAYEITV